MKTLYLDCINGISGDMLIGALIDAGADPQHLTEQLKKLNIENEYELSWKKVIKNGISSTKFDVKLAHDHDHDHHHSHSHDHDHDHHHGHSHSHDHEHDHHHEHSHSHDHDHEHHHEHSHSHDHDHEHHHEHHHEHSHSHDHEHDHHHGHSHSHDHDHDHHHSHSHDNYRSYKDIVKLINEAHFNKKVTDTALEIFKKIGEAEAYIHGQPLENVHFHEVGAVDSIIDIVGVAILLDHLQIDDIKCSAVPVGSGKIRIDHGIYPVPAPATLEILKGVPIEASDVRAELTTPTGAAFAAVLADEYGAMPAMTIQSIGYGAGTKTFPLQPNVVRVVIGE